MHLTSAGEVMGPYVARGTRFTVEFLDDVVAAPYARAFRGSIRDPLRAPDGRVVVRKGAFIHGWVLPVRAASGDTVAIDLTTVQTMDGYVPIAAARIGQEPSSDFTVYDFSMPPASAGSSIELALTEPFVPVGSTYR